MMKHSENILYWGISGAIFLFSACVPVYLYMQINDAGTELQQLAAAVADQSQKEQAATLAQQSLADTQAERAQIDSLALPADGAADFIGDLEREAHLAGVSVSVNTVNATSKDGLFDTLNLSFKATGSFAALTRYLRIIETLPTAVTIKTISLTSIEDKNAAWALIVEMYVPIHKQS